MRYDDRESASKRGYGTQWQKIREAKLRSEPLCETCLSVNRITAADTVHHRDEDQFNNRQDNLMSMCRLCHEKHHGRLNDAGCGVDGLPVDPMHRWNK